MPAAGAVPGGAQGPVLGRAVTRSQPLPAASLPEERGRRRHDGRVTVLVCHVCGAVVDADADVESGIAALTWVAAYENGRDVRYCPSCARENLRAIEGKLDSEFF